MNNDVSVATAPYQVLLPLRSVVVTLECLSSAQFRFFHQAALSAFCRHLLGEHRDYDLMIRTDAVETGRIHYQQGDYYRFTLIGLAGCDTLLTTLLEQLSQLPASAPVHDAKAPLRNNWRLVALHDSFSEAPIDCFDDCTPYGQDALDLEIALWQGQHRLNLHWLSPARLLKETDDRGKLKGDARYCRDNAHFTAELLLNRCHDALNHLLRERNADTLPRSAPPEVHLVRHHLFWADSHYVDNKGKAHSMGGMSGQITLLFPAGISTLIWQRLLLAQYIGIGQRASFGWGRFQLHTDEHTTSYRRALPARSLLMQAAEKDNVVRAYRHILKNRSGHHRDPLESDAMDGSHYLEEQLYNDAIEEADNEQNVVTMLQQRMEQLLHGRYNTPELRGAIIDKPNGGVRPLAIPPFWDSVLQRAVAQVLTPAFEKLMHERSYGYRPGRSRLHASMAVQKAWREGYRWVYESDIEDFFNSVDNHRLHTRLRCLLGDDPVINAITQWMAAPVRFHDQLIHRPNGLPQGSPLSPLMANLILDDFDSDMHTAGFRIIRYADDFIVLCKDPQQAEEAGEKARASLAEHGLQLKHDKTHITDMEAGFEYLGYLFVNDMALDIGGQQGEQNKPAPPPPNSWLARLNERQHQRIKQQDTLEKISTQLKGDALTTGERTDEGTLLCVSGVNHLITTHNKRLRVFHEDELITEHPLNALQAVILFGNHHITTPAMRAALEANVPVHLASGAGRYQGTLWSGHNAHRSYTLWLQQLLAFRDPERALTLSKAIVISRLRQQKETLRQRQLSQGFNTLDKALKQVNQANDLAALNGIEGHASREYFQQLGYLIPSQFHFNGRNRRPPKDPLNVLLSLGYTLLHGYTDSILRSIGLLPWQGFYHQPRGRHATLASDMMEPFRHLVERSAVSQITQKLLTQDDFHYHASGACQLTPDARRHYLAHLTARFAVAMKAKGATQPEKVYTHMHQQGLSLYRHIVDGEVFTPWRTR